MRTHSEELKDLFSEDFITSNIIRALAEFNDNNIDLKSYNIKEVHVDDDYFSVELYNEDTQCVKWIDANSRQLCNKLDIEITKTEIDGLKSTRAINKEINDTYGYDDNRYGRDGIEEILEFAGLNIAQIKYFFIWLFDNYNIMTVYSNSQGLLIKTGDKYSTTAFNTIELMPKVHKYIKLHYAKKKTF